MDIKKLFSTIDGLYQQYLNVLIDIAKIESPTDYKIGVDNVCNFLINHAKSLGLAVEVGVQNVSGNTACITLNPNANGKPVCISGHMDTVHQVGGVNLNPIRIEGDKLFGPGVNDCKGGIVAGFMAIHALKICGYTARPVKLILQSDEENGSENSNKTTVDFMVEKAKNCVCFLNAEPNPNGITIERKGITCYKYDIKGVAAHAGNCVLGKSAIVEACHKIIELEKLKNVDSVTCNIGIINGGTAHNIVPDECSFIADFRYKKVADLEFINKIANKVANTSYVQGTTCNLTCKGVRKSMEITEKSLALYDKINDIYASCGFKKEPKISSLGGADSADISFYGIPCLDGFGTRGGDIHTNKEFCYISSLKESAYRMSAIACLIKD